MIADMKLRHSPGMTIRRSWEASSFSYTFKYSEMLSNPLPGDGGIHGVFEAGFG